MVPGGGVVRGVVSEMKLSQDAVDTRNMIDRRGLEGEMEGMTRKIVEKNR